MEVVKGMGRKIFLSIGALGLVMAGALCATAMEAGKASQTAALAPVANHRPFKLYLKDGSYQRVETYQIEGDRVRYYSVDRSDWEEIPKALVDFAATRRAESKTSTLNQQRLSEANKLGAKILENTAPGGFQIAPGVQLPGDPGFYAYDGTRAIRLIQSPGEEVKDKRRMILTMALPAPVVKKRDLVELPRPRSDIRITDLDPVFYVQSSSVKPDAIRLLPLRATKNARIIETVQGGTGFGQTGEIRESLPIRTSPVAPGVYKITLARALAPGEYAFGEILSAGKLNIDVWDFEIKAANVPEGQ